MGAADRWGDLPLIVDTSVWIWLPWVPPDIDQDFEEALRAGQLRTSPLVKLELLFGTANALEFEQREKQLSVVGEIPLSPSSGPAAVGALRDLKDAGSAGHHKVKMPDALVGAVAAERGFNVLHYDRHFDRLSDVLAFEAHPLAAPGSLTKT